MDVRSPLVAHFEAAKAFEPGECALDYPPKSSEALVRFDTAPPNARNDTASAKRLATPRVIVALVRMQLCRTLARTSPLPLWPPQCRDGIDTRFEHAAVVHV